MTEQQHTGRTPKPFTDAERQAWLGVGALVFVLGLIGLALSFRAVSSEFRPEFGLASWAVPVGADIGIFAFAGLSILISLRDMPMRWVKAVPIGLTGATVWFNIASAHSWVARGAHALMPVLWVLAVEAVDGAIRHHVGLVKGTRMDRIRRSRWLLAPASSARLFRRMRLAEITSFREALDRDAARAAVVGRLRLNHGRMWRSKAPLAERIALRLEGRDPAGLAQVLGDHAETVALLAGTAAGPVPDMAPEPVEDSALMPLDPIVYPASERPVLVPFAAFSAQRFPFAAAVKALPTGPVPGARENDGANAENERDTAVRMRREGASFQQIADALGRSKSWAFAAAGDVAIEHANGHSAA